MSQQRELSSEDIFWYQIEEMATDIACSIMQNPSAVDVQSPVEVESIASTSVRLALALRGHIIEERKQVKLGEVMQKFEKNHGEYSEEKLQ
jgi:hypothetical protein